MSECGDMAFIGAPVSGSARSTWSRRTNDGKNRIYNVVPNCPSTKREGVTMVSSTRQKTIRLRELLQKDQLHLMPCCFDGLSAKLVQRAGFDLTFLSGFATAGAHGLPDTGLLSFHEVESQVHQATAVIDIPLIADGDTGFGNPINVFRTVSLFARAGASGVLIEDQVNPKRYVGTHYLRCLKPP